MTNRVKMDNWGFPINYNMECGDDGVMRVKDGRTLGDYLNNPEIVEARKKSKHSNQEWILVTADMYESGLMAGIA